MKNADMDVTLLPESLGEILDISQLKGKRILEIGPKFGHHALWIDQNLAPSEYVFCDFIQDSELHKPWKDEIKSPSRWVYGDLRKTKELLEIEPFDLVLFLGVIYHSYHHSDLLGIINRVIKNGGKMLLESTVDDRNDSCLRLRWVNNGRLKIMPTVDTLRLMLTWTGWRKIEHFIHYRPSSSEVLMLCEKTDNLIPPDYEFCSVVVPHKY